MNVSSLLLIITFALLPAADRDAIRAPENKRIPAEISRTIELDKDPPMRMPTDVAVTSKGLIYVADGVNDRIVEFNQEGRSQNIIRKVADHNLNQPVGLGMDQKDRLWIADTGNHRVVIYDTKQKTSRELAIPKDDDNNPLDVTDVAVSRDLSRAYIVDNDHHRIAVYSIESGNLKFMGQRGGGQGAFRWPFMVSIDPELNYVYVSEAIGARVQRISPEDRWAGRVGSWGVRIGNFYRPKGVVIDRKGNIYVSDSTLNVIQVFRRTGENLGVLTEDNGKLLRIDHPMGMDLGPHGELYVVEMKKNRVVALSMLQNSGNDKEQE
jgi:DNA-binding beta-propeller fold protein YncE